MKKAVKDEMRQLMQHNKKMQQQLQRVRMYKQLQRLKQQQKYLIQFNKQEPIQQQTQQQTKADKQQAKFIKDLEKRLEDGNKKLKQQLKTSQKKDMFKLPQTITGNNILDFLTMVGLSKFYPEFVIKELHTLGDIKNTKKQVFDEIGIPVPDQIKMFKKLRAMGVK